MPVKKSVLALECFNKKTIFHDKGIVILRMSGIFYDNLALAYDSTGWVSKLLLSIPHLKTIRKVIIPYRTLDSLQLFIIYKAYKNLQPFRFKYPLPELSSSCLFWSPGIEIHDKTVNKYGLLVKKYRDNKKDISIEKNGIHFSLNQHFYKNKSIQNGELFIKTGLWESQDLSNIFQILK